MIPDDMEDVDTALDTLKELYGDVERLIKAKKDKIIALGQLPKPSSIQTAHLKEKIDWCMKLEILLKDLVNLAADNDDYKIVVGSIVQPVVNMFKDMGEKITGLTTVVGIAKGVNKIQVILDFIVEYRVGIQNNYKFFSLNDDKANNDKSKKGAGANNFVEFQSLAIKLFKTPRRYEDCKICNILQCEGDTEDLFEDHFANQPFGCARFIKMNIADRLNYVKEANVCSSCLDADTPANAKSHDCKGKRERELDSPS